MLGLKRGPKPKELIKTEWSANFAYAIGLLATDGCIARGTTLIDLTSKDREQLNNFNHCIGLRLKISSKNSGYAKNKNGGLRVQIKNRIFYDFLVSIGFTPAKSKTLGKIKVPDKYFYDFLRGCFDGDGCFYSYWDPRWKSSVMFYTEFASASSRFISWLRNKIYADLGISGHITKDGRGITEQLKYAKADSIKILVRMYHSPRVVCLSRKRLKMSKVFDSIGLSVKHITRSA